MTDNIRQVLLQHVFKYLPLYDGEFGRVAMNREEEFERGFLYARLLGQGISFLMTKLLIEHVRTQGNDLEASMIATRAMLEWSLLSFQGGVQTEDGIELEITDETRGKLRLIVDVIEREARETLNLAPPVKDRH